MYTIVSLFIYHTGKSWILSLLTGTAVGLNAFLTWYFLRTFGMIGAAYAPVLALGVTLILSMTAALKLWSGKFTIAGFLRRTTHAKEERQSDD
jgi:O-antigen/teichoic acid export membrane protein